MIAAHALVNVNLIMMYTRMRARETASAMPALESKSLAAVAPIDSNEMLFDSANSGYASSTAFLIASFIALMLASSLWTFLYLKTIAVLLLSFASCNCE